MKEKTYVEDIDRSIYDVKDEERDAYKVDEGLTEAIVEQISRRRHTMCQYFTVDDLAYLERGGRVSKAAAIVGTVLKIKPLLRGDDEARSSSAARRAAVSNRSPRWRTFTRSSSPTSPRRSASRTQTTQPARSSCSTRCVSAASPANA